MYIKKDVFYPIAQKDNHFLSNIRAIWTGECRAPHKGEWFLSGAIIEAYQAKGDEILFPYHIAKLVAIKTIITEIIECELDNYGKFKKE